MKKIAIITGASSGFGKAIAELLAQNNFNLILLARRADKLLELKNNLLSLYGCECLTFTADVRNLNEVENACDIIPENWRNWEVLINNAGLAVGKESVEIADTTDWDRMIDTNIKGLLNTTRTFVRSMIQRNFGTIINVGSIAGKEVYPGGNVYSATKFAVDALTKSMRLDFLPYGIRVGQIAPGAAETEFSIVRFKGDESKAESVYKGFSPLSASDVADAVFFMISRPPHVCINDMVIMPTAQANATNFLKKNV